MSSYYTTVKGTKVDRRLWEAAEHAVQGRGDGRISQADAQRLIELVLDGAGPQGEYTDVEKDTIRLIRETLRWTPAADDRFRQAIRSAAASRWQDEDAALVDGTGDAAGPSPEPDLDPRPEDETGDAEPSAGPHPVGTLSSLFPAESRFAGVSFVSAIPPNADRGAISEDAHVLNYTTADGAHYCELWWGGGSGGTPLIAVLVDEDGPHYLPELSEPKLEADPPFDSVAEAVERFVQLAEAFYAAAGRDGTDDFAATVSRALEDAGVPSLDARFSAEEVQQQRQAHGGSLSFAEALAQALGCLRADASGPESPLSLVTEVAAGEAIEGTTDPAEALRRLMDRASSSLVLVKDRDYDPTTEDADDFVDPPSNGETLEHHWAFRLAVLDFSDHAFWALVHRDGAEPPYCYGFN